MASQPNVRSCSVKTCFSPAPYTWETFAGGQVHFCDTHVPKLGYTETEEVVRAVLEVLGSYTQGFAIEHLTNDVLEWQEKQ
ncbi:MAG: hypothetical protein Q8R28_11350 [Dehalococcoidia bacterium]|nr:hypothetical protein [Dehalococcoidia bacterium]